MNGSASVLWFLPTHRDGRYLAAGASTPRRGAFARLFDETVKTFGDIATERQIVAGD